MNYRKFYIQQRGEIPFDWDVHHIDFDHKNNNINNLIAVPKIVHTIIHQTGFLKRKEIIMLTKLYKNLLPNSAFKY